MLLALRRSKAIINGDSNNAVGVSALGDNGNGLFNQAMGAFALSVIALALQTSPLVTRHSQTTQPARLTRLSATWPEQDLSTATITSISAQPPAAVLGDESCEARFASAILDSSMPALSAASPVYQ